MKSNCYVDLINATWQCTSRSEYVWQRGVESLQGRVTAAWSWPLFREKKNSLRRCYEKPPGRNFDFRAKSSWEKIFIYVKNFLSGGFCSKVKIVAGQAFPTPPKVIFFLLEIRVNFGRRNSALQTPHPPLPYIFSTVWTWGFTRWYPKYTIPIQKFE